MLCLNLGNIWLRNFDQNALMNILCSMLLWTPLTAACAEIRAHAQKYVSLFRTWCVDQMGFKRNCSLQPAAHGIPIRVQSTASDLLVGGHELVLVVVVTYVWYQRTCSANMFAPHSHCQNLLDIALRIPSLLLHHLFFDPRWFRHRGSATVAKLHLHNDTCNWLADLLFAVMSALKVTGTSLVAVDLEETC